MHKVKFFNFIIIVLFCYHIINTGHAHDGTGAGGEMHDLYHKVSDSYRLVDMMKLRNNLTNQIDIYSYYFDPDTNSLYSCIGEHKIAVCSGPERSNKIAWTKSSMQYGQQNKLTPIDRKSHGPVYFFEGSNPFSQSTRYIYYSGEGKVVKCQQTFTSYNFELNRNGEYLYFNSKLEDEFNEECKRIYP